MAEWYIFAVLAAVLSGLIPVTEKKVLKGLDVLEFSCFFALMNLLLSIPLAFYIDLSMPLDVLAMIALSSLISSFAFYNMMRSVKAAPISTVSPLKNLNSTNLALLSYVILGEQLAPTQFMGIGLMVIGAYAMEMEGHVTNFMEPINRLVKSKVVHLVLLATLLYPISAMIDKVVLTKVSIYHYLIAAHFFIFLNFSFMVFWKHYNIKKLELDFEHSMGMIFLSSVLAVLSRLFQAKAMSLAFVSLVIPIRRMDSLIATIIGGELFHEKHLKQRVVSAIIMVVGVLLVVS